MSGANISESEINEPNRWRLETPGHSGWKRTARPDDPDKYLMISADCHCNEPSNLWVERIDRKFRDRLPRIEVDENGVKWAISEGWARSRLLDSRLEGEDHLRSKAGADPEQRLKDQIRDGVDAEIIFPNKGLTMWATPDADFAHAQCRIYNDWAWETFAKYNDRMSPLAAIATADLPGSIEEVERVAKLGFRGLTLPCKPIFGAHDARHPNYNLPIFDPLWSVIQEADLPITFHVSTGRDPRAARKDGGAVINYVSHSLVPTIEPVANLCGSGVLERFPGIKFAAIESGIGWVAWALGAMDEAYHKHHMWALPRLKMLPSEYFRAHGYASFQEDPVGLDLAVKYNLTNNFLWANDYPHHEGSWPHSAEAIEREMGGLPEDARAKILGLNAARLFKFDVDALTKSHRDRVGGELSGYLMPSSEFSHHYANLEGVRIHYVTMGQGAPVVLLHGWPQTWYEWRRVMPLLADKYSLVAPDMRGLGDSSRPTSGYDKKTVANDIWMLMHEHLKHARFAVVGHDWGAPVAFRLAADHPNEVTHLAMLDVPVPGDQPAGCRDRRRAAMVAPVPSGARSARSACLRPRTALSRILLHERMRSGRRDRPRRHRGIRAHLLAAGRDARGLQLLPCAHERRRRQSRHLRDRIQTSDADAGTRRRRSARPRRSRSRIASPRRSSRIRRLGPRLRPFHPRGETGRARQSVARVPREVDFASVRNRSLVRLAHNVVTSGEMPWILIFLQM